MNTPRLVRSVYGLEICLAWATMLTGAILPEIIGEFHLSLGQAGLIGTAQNIAALAAVLVAGVLAGRLGPGPVLSAGGLMLALCAAFFALAPSYALLLAGAGLIGLGIGVVDPMANAELARVTDAGRARYLSLLHMFYGLGATVTPLLAASLLGLGAGWRGTALIGLAISLGLWLYFAGARNGADDGPAPQGHGGAVPWCDPRLYTIAAAMVLYAGAYRSLGIWLVTYFKLGLSASAASAAGSLSLLCISVTAGRFIASRTGDTAPRPRLLALYSVGGALSLVLFNAGAVWTAWVGLSLYGLATAGIYPIVTTYGVEIYPGRPGLVTGLIYGAGAVAGIVMPWMLGAVAEQFGLRNGMRLTLWEMCAAALCFILLRFLENKPHPTPAHRSAR